MKREIKFRAWDKIRKQMFLNVEYGVDLGLWQPFGAVLEVHDDMIDFEVMQFTGLLDKNGKEIYEGDIVKCRGNESMFGEVVFVDGSFTYIHRGKPNKDYNTGEHITLYEGDEIIGNVYENPELL